MKKSILIVLITALVLSSVGCSKNDIVNNQNPIDTPIEEPENIEDNLPIPYIKVGDVLDGMNLSGFDLRNSGEALFSVNFDTETIFPEKDKLPDNFMPQELIEWAKNPGLNIRSLHEKGITGRGVNIAYVDQPLLIDHEEYADKNIHYEKIREEDDKAAFERSMHGPGVTSILLGENLGVAPDVNLYYIAHPAWLQDYMTYAEAIYRIIEINNTLPEDNKIKIIGFSKGFSHNTGKNMNAFKKAYDEAIDNGIMIFTTDDKFLSARIDPYMNRDDYKNYRPADWIVENFGKSTNFGSRQIFAPSTFTIAGYYNSMSYGYDYEGGLSWVVPYVVGLSALGLQIDPTLTKEEILDYMFESSYEYNGLRIVNPEGFIDLVISRNGGSSYLAGLNPTSEDTKNIESINNLKKLKEEENRAKEDFLLSIPIVKSNSKDRISYIDDGVNYANLEYVPVMKDNEIKIESVGVAYEDNYVNVKLKLDLPIEYALYVFLQGDAPGLEVKGDDLKVGDNAIILKFQRNELLNYTAGLGIALGNINYIFIEKDLLDKISSFFKH